MVDARDASQQQHVPPQDIDEAVVRDRERRFRSLVEATSQVVWIASVDGTPIWSKGWVELTGQKKRDLRGRGWLEAVHPDDRDHTFRTWRSSLETGEHFCHELRIRRKQGDYHHFVANAVPVREEQGHVVEWIGTLRDVTDRKRYEAALERAQERYRQLVDLAPEAMVVHIDGRMVYANHAAARLVGAAGPEQLIGRNVLDFVHTDSRDEVIERMREIKETGEPQPLMLEKLVRLDGRVLDAEVVAMPTQYDDKSAVHVALHDVTQARLLEEERKRFRQELASQVRDRTAALQSANRELESFTYSVSHDLRAPLRGVTTFANLLADEHGEELSPEGQDLLKRLCNDAERMQQIVEDLLKLARSARGEVQRRTFNLAQVAREVSDALMRNEPSTRNVKWLIPDEMEVSADLGLVRVVLENLMGNALKFTREKDVARIEVGERDHEGRREFYVRDNGAGFEMSKAGRLFQPFQRLHVASRFEGTGIGLATVARIIERHGGRVRAEGAPGQGATIAFTLAP